MTIPREVIQSQKKLNDEIFFKNVRFVTQIHVNTVSLYLSQGRQALMICQWDYVQLKCHLQACQQF